MAISMTKLGSLRLVHQHLSQDETRSIRLATRPDVGDDPVKHQQFIEDYEQNEGIRLDPNNISKNPGRRQLAKIMLNSFWGKFGQQSNKRQVKAFTSPAKF